VKETILWVQFHYGFHGGSLMMSVWSCQICNPWNPTT